MHPRIRGPQGEISLESYAALKNQEHSQKELLQKVLRGISLQRYKETVIDSAHALELPPTSLSRHIVEVTAKKLAGFKERDLSSITPFAIFMDTIFSAPPLREGI
jgi:hypothetical protein